MRVCEPYKKDSVTTQTKARTSFLVQLCVEIICIHFFTGLTLKAFILLIAKFFCPDAFIQVIFWKEILKFSLTRVVNRTRKTATHRSIEMQWLKTKMNQFFFSLSEAFPRTFGRDNAKWFSRLMNRCNILNFELIWICIWTYSAW